MDCSEERTRRKLAHCFWEVWGWARLPARASPLGRRGAGLERMHGQMTRDELCRAVFWRLQFSEQVRKQIH